MIKKFLTLTFGLVCLLVLATGCGAKPIELTMSDWGYDSVKYINENCFIVKEDDKYFFIDNSGNKLENLKTSNDKTITNEFTGYRSDLQNGAIAVSWKDGESTKTVLYDKDLNCLKSYTNVNFEDYRYDVVEYFADSKYKIFSLNGKGFSNSSSRYYIGAEYIKGSANKFYTYSVKDEGVELGEGKVFTVDGLTVSAWNGAVNPEGWIVCSLKDNGSTKKTGFYNLKTEEFIETSDEIVSWKNLIRKDGSSNTAVLDGIAIGKTGKDDTAAYQVYELAKKQFVSDKYKSISVYEGKTTPYLVEYLDEKWGFIDKTTFAPVGEKYDDVSNFCNGYAMATNNGETYLINEKFEKVSTSLTGMKSAQSVTDIYNYVNLGNQAKFLVKDSDDKYHLVTVDITKINN